MCDNGSDSAVDLMGYLEDGFTTGKEMGLLINAVRKVASNAVWKARP
ncbi:MAG: hypothetical protein ACLP05_11730 [Candidatus Kryptoniota bacterium]